MMYILLLLLFSLIVIIESFWEDELISEEVLDISQVFKKREMDEDEFFKI